MVGQRATVKDTIKGNQRIWHRQIKLWHIASAAVVLIILYIFWSWWISPEHKISQFKAAFNRDSLNTMLSLASSEEVAHLGLTPVKLNGIVNDAAQSPRGIHLAHLSAVQTNEAQHRYYRAFLCDLTDRQGQPLMSPDGQKAQVYLIAYNSTTGWHIALSKFLIGMSRARGLGRYPDICRRNSVPVEIFEPANASWQAVGK